MGAGDSHLRDVGRWAMWAIWWAMWAMWAIWWAMWANTGNPVPQNDVVAAVFLFTQVDQTDKKRDGCFDKQEKMLTRV